MIPECIEGRMKEFVDVYDIVFGVPPKGSGFSLYLFIRNSNKKDAVTIPNASLQ